jgi:hypothetical protein
MPGCLFLLRSKLRPVQIMATTSTIKSFTPAFIHIFVRVRYIMRGCAAVGAGGDRQQQGGSARAVYAARQQQPCGVRATPVVHTLRME